MSRHPLTLNRVRIIGGQWRSRFIEFQPTESLRPTTDRIRETLFNWLIPDIQGAVCLDLFAGSGVLGFEALSRGAKQVVMVEQSPISVTHLKRNAEKLGVDCPASLTICQAAFPEAINHLPPDTQFDIVFIDPPFDKPELLLQSINQLEKTERLTSTALIYIEAARSVSLTIPASWHCERHKQTKQVQYGLYRLNE